MKKERNLDLIETKKEKNSWLEIPVLFALVVIILFFLVVWPSLRQTRNPNSPCAQAINCEPCEYIQESGRRGRHGYFRECQMVNPYGEIVEITGGCPCDPEAN